MKICLINPPLHYKPDFVQHDAHIGICYIASFLEQNNYNVDIIDCTAEDLELTDLFKTLNNRSYDVVGISTYEYNFKSVKSIVKKVRELYENCFIVLGGYLPSLQYNEIFKEKLDINCCVYGEGEYTMLDIVNAIEKEEDWKKINGIVYEENNKIVKNDPRTLIEDLDILPFPKRKKLQYNSVANIITSRGCYANCSFCSNREIFKLSPGKAVRIRGIDKVVEEIEYLVNTLGFKRIDINDDNFIGSSKFQKRRLNEFCDLIKEKKLNFSFRSFSRADDLINNADMIDRLKEVGLEFLIVGIESFVQRQLDFFNKRVTVEENIKAIKIIQEKNLDVFFGFILLDPYSTIEEVIENLTVLKNLDILKDAYKHRQPISASNILYVHKGTDVHKHLVEKGLYTDNPKGYEFVHDEINLFTEILQEWKNRILQLFLSSIDTDLYKEDPEKFKLFLYYKDLEFLLSVSYQIKEAKVNNDNYKEFIESFILSHMTIQSLLNSDLK